MRCSVGSTSPSYEEELEDKFEALFERPHKHEYQVVEDGK